MTSGETFPNDRGAVSSNFVDWLEASRQGSDTDLGKMLESCRGYLLAVAELELGSTLRPKAGASDLVQDSLLEAQKGFERFRGSTHEEFFAWASAILRRNLLDLARRYRSAECRSVGREEHLEWLTAIPESAVSPSERASLGEESARLRAAIARLPPEAAAAIHWRHEHGLGWEEIGVRLDKSAEAVRKIWFRAIERLRRELGGNDDEIG